MKRLFAVIVFGINCVLGSPTPLLSQQEFKLYKYLNTSGKFSMRSGDDSFVTSSELWKYETFEIQSGIRVPSFVKRPGHLASDALNDFLMRGGLIECRMAMQLVLYKMILNQSNKEMFNEMFESVRLGDDLGWSFISLIEGKTMPTSPGEFGYIANTNLYKYICPVGHSNGENVVCVDITPEGPVYVGFGGLFSDGCPKSLSSILDSLYVATMMPILGEDSRIEGRRVLQSVYQDKSAWEKDRKEAQKKSFVFKPRLGL